MIDIHCHILPGIDDGPKNWAESLKMAQIACKDGIRKIVATPHYIKGSYEPPVKEVLSLTKELNERIKKEGLQLEILPGMEVYMDPELPEWVKNEKVLTFNNERKYILIEFPPDSMSPQSERVFYELRLQGIMPILAHPERNEVIMKDPQKLFPFVEKGLLTQVTASSLHGHFGSGCRDTADFLLNHNMAHFIASDAHFVPGRMPELKKTYELLREKSPVTYDLLKKYESDFEKGKYVVQEEPIPVKTEKRRNLFERLKTFFIK